MFYGRYFIIFGHRLLTPSFLDTFLMKPTKCTLVYYISLPCSSYMFRHVSHYHSEEFTFSLFTTIKTIQYVKIHGMECFKILTPSTIFREIKIFLYGALLHVTDGDTDNICTQLLSRGRIIRYQLFAQC